MTGTGLAGASDPPGRWEALAFDLEAQAAAWDAAERAGEVAERQRIEAGQLRLVDRLRADQPAPVALVCAGGLRIHGRLVRVVSDAAILAEAAGREALVALPAVLVASGLGRFSADPASQGAVDSRIGLRHLARGIVRDRSVVRVHLIDGSVLDGTLDRVGADFVELALHPAGEARRRDAVRESAAVALSAVAAIRRDGG